MTQQPVPATNSLDPEDWTALRALGHRMLDDVFDQVAGLREAPVWQRMPDAVRGSWSEALPRTGADPETVYADFQRLIAPYGVGNRHPQFFGWVHGGGTMVGALAELLAGGLNANCGGRDHAPIACEAQVIRWSAEMLSMPATSSGLVVSGTSIANLVAILVARTAALGPTSRRTGAGEAGLTAYASEAAHICVSRALDMAGIGSDALAMLAPSLHGLAAGIGRADSVAFDFHKWAQVPYDAGCVVVRDGAAHRAAFERSASYLRRETHGLAAGEPWPVDLGPELSRGFRALKVWMTLKTYGADRLGQVVERCCALAGRLAASIDAEPLLERGAPVALNVVCFRYAPGDDAMQAQIAADLQEAGAAVLSTTTLNGRVMLRAAIVNHRTGEADVGAVPPLVLEAGKRLRSMLVPPRVA